jgi:uncharacterized protein YcbX
LVSARRQGAGNFECPEDFEREDSPTTRWQGPGHSYINESDLHRLTTADLLPLRRRRPELHWDVRRLRANIVLDAGEDETSDKWIGQLLRNGDAVVRVTGACTRYVMTTRAPPGGVERQLDIERHVIRRCDNVVSVRAAVVQPGRVITGGGAHVVSSDAL